MNIDWPDLSWSDLQLPSFSVPGAKLLADLVPVPDLPGTPTQWVVLVPALTALAGLLLSGRSSRLAAWIAVGGGLLTVFFTLAQVYVQLNLEDPRHTAGTTGSLPFGELDVPFTLGAG